MQAVKRYKYRMKGYIALLVLGIVLMAVALVLLLRHWRVPAAVPAYLGLVALHFSTYTTFPTWVFWFYAVATVLVMALSRLTPSQEPDGRQTGNLYVGLGALMGCLLGMLAGARLMMLGVALGGIAGEFAYSSTPAGKWLKFSYSNFYAYFCARVLQAIVAAAMIGVAVEGFVYDL